MTKLTLHDCLDAAENFLPALPCFAACNEVGRQFFPLLGKFTKIGCYILLTTYLTQFVGLGEDYAKGDAILAKQLYEAKVYLSTPDLFAWTLVIIVLAIVFERIMLRLSEFIIERVAR